MEELLVYDRVSVSYNGKPVLRDITFSLRAGEILGIVGASGSGKSSVLRAALGILGRDGAVTGGSIRYRGQELRGMKEKRLRGIRGRQIGMIFQDAEASLCPVRTIGDQIHESLKAHEKISRAEADKRAVELFAKLGLPDGKRILDSYPFELSGGMNQRVCIAMAMLPGPAVLLADEPSSALDVISRKQVVEEMRSLREIYGTAVIVVTHNMGVVSAMADRVLVLHDGGTVEYGEAAQVLSQPRAEYTKELLAAVPKLKRKQESRLREEKPV